MAGYWPHSFFFAFLWTNTSSGSINTQKNNLANIQPSWPNTCFLHNTVYFEGTILYTCGDLNVWVCQNLKYLIFTSFLKGCLFWRSGSSCSGHNMDWYSFVRCWNHCIVGRVSIVVPNNENSNFHFICCIRPKNNTTLVAWSFKGSIVVRRRRRRRKSLTFKFVYLFPCLFHIQLSCRGAKWKIMAQLQMIIIIS